MSGLRFKVSEIQVSTNLIPPSRDTACRVRTPMVSSFALADTACRVPTSYHLYSVICYLSSAICHLYSVHFLPLSQGEYHEVGRGYDVSFTFRFPSSCFPSSVFRFLFSVYIIPPPPAGLSSRRTGECSPQRAQNDIQSFL